MKLSRLVVVLGPGLLVASLLAFNCTGGMGNNGDGGIPPDAEQVMPACDPDGVAPCPDDWFLCVDTGANGKHCEGQEAAVPDGGGDWECVVEDGMLVCSGHQMPDATGDWVCVDYGDTDGDGQSEVICRMHGYIPSGGGEGSWDCYYEGEFVVCDYTDGGGGGTDADVDSDVDSDADSDLDDDSFDECPPGIEMPTDEVCDDGVDNDCDGRVDEDCGEPPPDDCVCVPGAWRYCDTPMYCRWGIQHCAPDGLEWGACDETTTIPAECIAIDGWYSPRAEECCISRGYCCQDMWDLDHDGDTWESSGDCTDITCV